jgi:hypothetical protein
LKRYKRYSNCGSFLGCIPYGTTSTRYGSRTVLSASRVVPRAMGCQEFPDPLSPQPATTDQRHSIKSTGVGRKHVRVSQRRDVQTKIDPSLLAGDEQTSKIAFVSPPRCVPIGQPPELGPLSTVSRILVYHHIKLNLFYLRYFRVCVFKSFCCCLYLAYGAIRNGRGANTSARYERSSQKLRYTVPVRDQIRCQLLHNLLLAHLIFGKRCALFAGKVEIRN